MFTKGHGRIGRMLLAALIAGAVFVYPAAAFAQIPVSSIAEARKLAIDAWNSQAPAAPYVRVAGIITAQPSGPDRISSAYFWMQDSATAGTELPPGSGRRYSNAIKVFFSGNSNVVASQLQRGDYVEVTGLAKIYHGGSTTLGMEVEIDASFSTGAFAGSVVKLGSGSPPPPLDVRISDLPFAGGIGGGENLVTRHRIMGHTWYPEPSTDPQSERHFVDNPYQGMLVRVVDARKWGVFAISDTSGAQRLGDFFLSEDASPGRVLRVRVPSTANVDASAASNGSTEPVIGMLETRQVLVGQKAYSVAQLVLRETADVQETQPASYPCITRTQAFVDNTTPDRTRLPGTSVIIRAWVSAPDQTVTADLSAFGLSLSQPLTPGATQDDPYSYTLVIPEGQAPGQYIVPIHYQNQHANVLVSVAARVDTIGQTRALPDDMWVYVNTPRVVTSGALGFTGSVPPGFTGGFRQWLFVGDPDGTAGILGFGWPAGAQADPNTWIRYDIGERVLVFGQLTTYFAKREVIYPGGTATYSIKTGEPLTTPRPMNMRLDLAQPEARPNPIGALVRVTGKVISSNLGNRQFTIQDATGARATVKIQWRQPFPPTSWYPAVGKTVIVTGLLDGFLSSDPETGWDRYTVDIYPRNEADLTVVD
ncbi:MAG: hypothetical protein WHZ52_13225 [Armatimonadota bacterium]